MAESILWYDFETSGVSPTFDRALQFAAVRTDLDLKPIEEPINLYCYPGNDVVPDPEAMLVTGLKMTEIRDKGLSEARFAAEISKHFCVPQTCVAGFNSIRFDDEFTRNLFYRNFYDPYSREWQGGNSRWDVIDLFRMASALRPDGFTWPRTEEGIPTFKLERLTQANGVSHEGAHDAVADVLATIDVVRKLRSAQPKLYDYLFNLRRKKAVIDQLYPLGKQAIVHVSSMYPAKQNCIAVVLPITVHPTNPNGVVCFDLSKDPSALIQLGPEELHRRVFSSNAELVKERIPLKTIHVNKAPAIAPLSTLSVRQAELAIDLAVCDRHKLMLQQAAGVVEKIQEAFSKSDFETTDDPDLMLYQGEFFSSADKDVMQSIHSTKPEQLSGFAGQFRDTRLPEMLFRFRARNFPESLNAGESERWSNFVSAKVDSTIGQDRRQRLQSKLSESAENEVLQDLAKYLASIG